MSHLTKLSIPLFVLLFYSSILSAASNIICDGDGSDNGKRIYQFLSLDGKFYELTSKRGHSEIGTDEGTFMIISRTYSSISMQKLGAKKMVMAQVNIDFNSTKGTFTRHNQKPVALFGCVVQDYDDDYYGETAQDTTLDDLPDGKDQLQKTAKMVATIIQYRKEISNAWNDLDSGEQMVLIVGIGTALGATAEAISGGKLVSMTRSLAAGFARSAVTLGLSAVAIYFSLTREANADEAFEYQLTTDGVSDFLNTDTDKSAAWKLKQFPFLVEFYGELAETLIL
ncbi:MAG: hypothetical protein ISR65_12115 [Bacteriovoracaceae bacterium]|nr:hypothetical protein [Bacteriovoracaceae bacterium]